MNRTRQAGAALLAIIVLSAAAAPGITPHDPGQQFGDHGNAPPMIPRVIDREGALVRPFVYPLTLVDRLERRYEEDRAHPAPIRWMTAGALASIDESHGPWLPLGADPLGRDVFARLLYGARLSLGLAAVATAGALLAGVLIGAPAGFLGGRIDTLLMGIADFILILPAIFIVLAVRSAMPLVLTVPQVFWVLTGILAGAGWPIAARGVRAIIAAEARREYAEAAHSAGAGPLRILLRHLLPASASFLAVAAALMVPAFILAESTISLVGLGFPIPSASWGTMMREGWEGGGLGDAPWLLAPGIAVMFTVLSLHLLAAGRAPDDPTSGTFY
jgi:peptide/nickel transport system permease protein